jgi:hypothetical protein
MLTGRFRGNVFQQFERLEYAENQQRLPAGQLRRPCYSRARAVVEIATLSARGYLQVVRHNDMGEVAGFSQLGRRLRASDQYFLYGALFEYWDSGHPALCNT